MRSLGYIVLLGLTLCLALSIAGAADQNPIGIGVIVDPPAIGCSGTYGQWSGCRGNGCAVCSELVALYPLYWENHPLCSPNDTCAGQYYTCNQACPEPTSADRCNGTYGQWQGCRGNGCSVCAELVDDYPLYFINHPTCSPNETCGGYYYTCNERCPAPTLADRCNTTPGDLNENGLPCDIGDAIMLEDFLGCERELTATQIGNSDLNADCLVDQADADYLRECLLGGPDPLDCVCDNPEVTDCRCSLPGDTNGNGIVVDVGDVIYLGNFLCNGGPAPDPLVNGNVDGDCDVDMDDYYAMLDILSYGGDPAACVCHDPVVGPCE